MNLIPPTDLAQANCRGQHQLFDSRNIIDHKTAAELCATCPIIAACRTNLQAVIESPKSFGGTPEGTWAGDLYGVPALPPMRRHCGSERGYHQHKYRAEVACRACLDARSAKQRERAAGHKARRAS